MPVAERGQGGECRQKVGCDGKRNDQGERSRIGSLWVLDVLGHARDLLVSGVEPNAQGEAHSEHFGKGLVRRNHRHKRIVMPLREAEDDQGDHGNDHKHFKSGGGFADRLNAANVDPGNAGDQRERHEPMLPAGDAGEIETEVVGKEHGVGTAQKERGGPVPPSGEESPKISEGGAGPAIEAAFDRHGCGEFGRDE